MKRPFWTIVINIVIGLSFIVYLLALYYFTIGKVPYLPGLMPNRHLANIVPLKTISEYISFIIKGNLQWRIAVINLVGNIILTVPLAIYLAYFIRPFRKLWKILAVSMAVILLIEIYQFFSGRGSFDIDDIILNLLGAAAGYGIWKTRPVQWIAGKLTL